jgi:hypothetical protein
VARQNLPFDFHDLSAAAFDSRRLLLPLLRDLVESPAVAVERGAFVA